ncbi:hypothetical protein Sulku_1705 [Sulfuricurvum kujiense DSM 16994]|uniref:Uncharacterized protein n=1 Tax=Sulfuricurvum kujiense (strain ATCC BAA-921 / DSM 16994 / JCM 11577 / YK-1) TaxID=709032 RepID=E4U0W4_SULKY|nr:hypothetical protein Sulku_1705 [Sulfuricurvum kujiense DSM 16994]
MSTRKMKYTYSKSQKSELSYTKIRRKLHKRIGRKFNRSIDNIIKIMKKRKYENLLEGDL